MIDVQVRVNTEMDQLPFPAAPPHCKYSPLLAEVDSGSNLNGKLSHYFYACTDSDFDQGRLVLWCGSTGSQEDDGIGRITPTAWIDAVDQTEDWEIESWYLPSLQFALLAISLASWIACGWIDRTDCLVNSEVLTIDELGLCWAKANTTPMTLKS